MAMNLRQLSQLTKSLVEQGHGNVSVKVEIEGSIGFMDVGDIHIYGESDPKTIIAVIV